MSELEFEISEQEWQEFQALVQQVEAAETDDFCELAAILGRNPKTDLAGADLRETNLSRADLSGADLSDANLRHANLRSAILSSADLSGADVKDARFGEGEGLSQETKRDLAKRGAIFDDAPGDRESSYVPVG
jgi:uncharacterized protein YjbI with pentapeptide repeats